MFLAGAALGKWGGGFPLSLLPAQGAETPFDVTEMPACHLQRSLLPVAPRPPRPRTDPEADMLPGHRSGPWTWAPPEEHPRIQDRAMGETEVSQTRRGRGEEKHGHGVELTQRPWARGGGFLKQ